jgi:hypothetical protein
MKRKPQRERERRRIEGARSDEKKTFQTKQGKVGKRCKRWEY